MSTATEGNPTATPPAGSGKQSGTLALLTLTALGGIVGARLGKTPLVLAAGAAAFALLNQKKSGGQTFPVTAAPEHEPEPELEPASVTPEPPPPAPSPVALWLAQQIDREERAAVADLTAMSAQTVAEDDYTPQSLLFEEADEAAPPPRSFAELSEPAHHAKAFAHPLQGSPSVAAPLSVLQALEATESSPTADASWMLRIEPLPSLDEAPSRFAIDPGLFTSSPMEGLPAPEIPAPVFEGGTLPDQIDVAPPPEPVVHLMPVLGPAPEVMKQVEPPAEVVVEIPVQLAAPGEASFDPPLISAPHDPWHNDITPPVVEPPPRVTTTLVDAEIVLRPRAPVQTAVVPKNKPGIPLTPPPAESPAAEESALTSGPELTRSQAAWRSMWGVE